jgi:sialate O-acetylesterase
LILQKNKAEMKKIIYFLLLFCFTANVLMARQTAFKVADILQSNMVVQQNKPFKVWGWAAAGSVVNINADWSEETTQVTAAADGSFLGIINVPAINPGNFTKHKLIVKNNNAEIVLGDILIGEVWICSGQSNMQFKLLEDKNAATELPLANNPNIRVFNAELNFSAEPIPDLKGKWLPCTTDHVKNFTAVGYYFGKLLQERLKSR